MDIDQINELNALHMDQYAGNRLPYMCVKSEGIRHQFLKIDGPEAGQHYDVIDGSGAYANACFGSNSVKLIEAFSSQSSYFTDEVFSKERYSLLNYILGQQGVWIDHFPYGDYHVAGRSSGSEGIELALRLVFESLLDKFLRPDPDKIKKKIIVSFEGAWHGWTVGAAELNARKYYHQGLPGIEGNTLGFNFEQLRFGDQAQLDAFLSEKGDQVAAIFVEPIQGDAGIIMPPSGYLRYLSEGCQKIGALLVADEVLTFGKTGRFFAMHDEQGPISTDITVIGKYTGMGVLSTSLVIAKKALCVRGSGAVSTNDLRPIACQLIEKGLRYMVGHDLMAHAERQGQALNHALKQHILPKFPELYSEVRGKGFMQGLALQPLAAKRVTQLRGCFLEAGVYLEMVAGAGRLSDKVTKLSPVIRIAPPLIAKEQDIQAILEAIEVGSEKMLALQAQKVALAQ